MTNPNHPDLVRELRERHREVGPKDGWGGSCSAGCGTWPCDAIRAADEIERLYVAWTGASRDHEEMVKKLKDAWDALSRAEQRAKDAEGRLAEALDVRCSRWDCPCACHNRNNLAALRSEKGE